MFDGIVEKDTMLSSQSDQDGNDSHRSGENSDSLEWDSESRASTEDGDESHRPKRKLLNLEKGSVLGGCFRKTCL
jgi:hypothetical protein